jgi:outer membrane protein TolC
VALATANLYPQLTLTATLGSLSTSGSGLFSSATAFTCWADRSCSRSSMATSCKPSAAREVAAYDQAAAAYRESILAAFQNVADTLRALEPMRGR